MKTKTETQVTCDGCKRWIGRLPYILNNCQKSLEIAKDAGWQMIWGHSRDGKKGRRMWYCPSCQKKVTVGEMIDAV